MLLDMEMPELDGFGVLEQLKQDGKLRDLPVIVTSSLEGLAHVVRCLELGADDYLRQPVCHVRQVTPRARRAGQNT
jgi:CheY-like chemotaxis protein